MRDTMLDVALSILALIAGGITLEAFAGKRLPVSQDPSGYYLGFRLRKPTQFVHPGKSV
jgi:hypothetical protein